jgi:hypothetical protein
MHATLPLPKPIHHREKQEEVTGELSMVFVKPEEPLAIGRVFVKEVATARSLRRPLPLEGKENGISISL